MSNDTFNVLIGAGIAFISGVLMPFIQRKFDEHGKLDVYCKVVADSLTERQVIFQNEHGIYQYPIPLHIELQNRKHCIRVARDICLSGYLNGKETLRWNQVLKTATQTRNRVLGNAGAYSTMIEEMGIVHLDCEFYAEIHQGEEVKKRFDEIRLTYYNEKGKKVSYPLIRLDDCYKPQVLPIQSNWLDVSRCKAKDIFILPFEGEGF